MSWAGTILFPPDTRGNFCEAADMIVKARHLSLPDRNSYRRLEDVVGCKWSAAVLAAIGRGIMRPGELERFIPGLSTKVLNERLRKLLAYGLVERTEHPGRVLRVEYRLTSVGLRLAGVIEQLRALETEHAHSTAPKKLP
jgi:DNA-binding HxlR family transcriptional regulator